MMNGEKSFTDEFSIGPCEIYVAGGRRTAEEMEDVRYRAGDMLGGCELRYEYKQRELYDVDGNIAGTLRYGEKARLKGKLCSISREAFGLLGKARGGVSVLVVCPLDEEEVLRFHMHGAVTSGLSLKLCDVGSAEFELCFGRGVARPGFAFTGGAA